MRTKISKFDISEDFQISHYRNGIKLIRPDKLVYSKFNSYVPMINKTVGQLLQLPIAVFFSDTNHISIKCNDVSAEECGYQSCKDIIGKKWFHYFKSNTIAEPLANSNEILKEKTTKITCEEAIRKDGSCNNILAVRMPWYSEDNKLGGIFGCAIILKKHSLAESLTQIATLGFLNASQVNCAHKNMDSKIQSVFLSKREMECLELTICGKTAKGIANILHLSKWTVEEYLSNIKNKFGVSSKSQLIEKVINAKASYSIKG